MKDGSTELLTQPLCAHDERDDAARARARAGLGTLPRQKQPLWRACPVLLDWQFAPAWPRDGGARRLRADRLCVGEASLDRLMRPPAQRLRRGGVRARAADGTAAMTTIAHTLATPAPTIALAAARLAGAQSVLHRPYRCAAGPRQPRRLDRSVPARIERLGRGLAGSGWRQASRQLRRQPRRVDGARRSTKTAARRSAPCCGASRSTCGAARGDGARPAPRGRISIRHCRRSLPGRRRDVACRPRRARRLATAHRKPAIAKLTSFISRAVEYGFV